METKCKECGEFHDYELQPGIGVPEIVTKAHGVTRRIIGGFDYFKHKVPLDPYPEGA